MYRCELVKIFNENSKKKRDVVFNQIKYFATPDQCLRDYPLDSFFRMSDLNVYDTAKRISEDYFNYENLEKVVINIYRKTNSKIEMAKIISFEPLHNKKEYYFIILNDKVSELFRSKMYLNLQECKTECIHKCLNVKKDDVEQLSTKIYCKLNGSNIYETGFNV